MVDFSAISVFILATTTLNTRFSPQIFPTYYESRILPITETWGSFFPHLYFVFGRNAFDYQFLTTSCSHINHGYVEHYHSMSHTDKENDKKNVLQEMEASNNFHFRRKLEPRTRQMKSMNKTTLFYCYPKQGEGKWREFPTNHSSKQFHQPTVNTAAYSPFLNSLEQRRSPWKALYIGNCTGEYFGSGPTCRCQETIRYFLVNKDSHFKNVQWFIFQDDDIYLRPYALQNFLSSFASEIDISQRPITFISSEMGFILRNVRQKQYEKDIENCRTLFQNSLHLAQPAIMNRLALERMRPSIDANAHLRLQLIWGGSHDVILGLMLWIHAIPQYAFSRIYYGTALHIKEYNEKVKEGFQAKYFIYHKVLNFISYQWDKNTRTANPRYTIASQYFIATLMGDDLLYDWTKEFTMEAFDRLIEDQRKLGKKGINQLIQLQESTIYFTKYYTSYGKHLNQSYEVDFLPSDCNDRN